MKHSDIRKYLNDIFILLEKLFSNTSRLYSTLNKDQKLMDQLEIRKLYCMSPNQLSFTYLKDMSTDFELMWTGIYQNILQTNKELKECKECEQYQKRINDLECIRSGVLSDNQTLLAQHKNLISRIKYGNTVNQSLKNKLHVHRIIICVLLTIIVLIGIF